MNVVLEVNEGEESNKKKEGCFCQGDTQGRQGRKQAGRINQWLKIVYTRFLFWVHNLSVCQPKKEAKKSCLASFAFLSLSHLSLLTVINLNTALPSLHKKRNKGTRLFQEQPQSQPVYPSHSHERQQPYKRMNVNQKESVLPYISPKHAPSAYRRTNDTVNIEN